MPNCSKHTTEEKNGSFLRSRFIMQYIPLFCFILQILVGIGMSFWVLYHLAPKTGDDVEHVHSAWLIAENKIPYIDFFQHHNPLLWYLFAPIVKYFAYDVVVIDVVRIISTCVMFITLALVGTIVARFMIKSKIAVILSIASIFPSYITCSGQDFRPDNYMIFSFILSLYWLLLYLDTQKRRYLVLSFFLAVISFFFMQKILFLLAVYGAVVIYELIKKDIKINDFLSALILPLFCAMFFLCWLIKYDMVETYWLSNYIFNLYIPDVYNSLVEKTKPEFYYLTAFAFISFLYFSFKGNKYARIICIFWVAEAIQRFFYFSLDRHYYYLLELLNAILVGALATVLVKRYIMSCWLLFFISMFSMNAFFAYVKELKLAPNYFRYVTPRYVLDNTNRCDSVINGYGLTYNVFAKDLTYYWNLFGQLDVIGAKINLSPLPNLDQVILKNLPKFIFTGPYLNEKLHKAGIDVPVHWVDPNIVKKYYNQSAFVNVFILKKEYENMRFCRYDKDTNTWNYINKE